MAISKTRYLEFVRLHAQLKSVDAVIGKLHGGEAGIAKEDVSDHAAAVANKLMKAASDYLGADSPLKDAVVLPLVKLPTHADILLFVGQLIAGFDAVKAQHVQFRHGRWYWVVQQDSAPNELEYVLVDPIAKADEAE